jgi:hypothetical protein
VSRWHVLAVNLPAQEAMIGHACTGAHSPSIETVSLALLSETDLGPKPTMACRMCQVLGITSDPHLPGPRDVEADLEPGQANAWLEEINTNWLAGRTTA